MRQPYVSIFILIQSSLLSTIDAFGWQQKLDKAFLNVDGSLQERLKLLQEVAQDSDFSADISKAFSVLREQGLKDGHPEVIDTLWPSGTIARSDIEGLQAFAKQLPERIEEIQMSPLGLVNSTLSQTKSDGNAVTSAALDLLQDSKRLTEKATNFGRSTPIGLDSPPYESVRNFTANGTTIEIRRYLPYRYAMCELKSSRFSLENIGGGLATLSSYLAFGYNQDNKVMGMTAPFKVDRGSAGNPTTMSFALPAAFTEEPPKPMDESGIIIGMTSEQMVAVKSFSGICTDQEIGRQKAALYNAVKQDDQLVYSSETECSILQYNAPGTIPWRRRNEIYLPVNDVGEESDDEDLIKEVEVEIILSDDNA